MRYDGVLLAGGAGRRLGGVNKPAITVGSRRLLDVGLEALAGAVKTVAVGPSLPSTRPVVWTRESPPGGGPVAAIGAALQLIRSSVIIVLAADLPFVTSTAIEQLVAEHTVAATVAVDDTGREQPLLACYDVEALAAAMPAAPHNASMRTLLRDIEVAGEVRRIGLGGNPPVSWDCDTAADLTRTRALL